VTIEQPHTGRNIRGALAGILAGGLALAVAQLISGLVGSVSSPVVAVGQLSIDFTPPAVKNFAISAFGSHDKVVLVSGILVILALFAAAIGILAVRRLAYGMVGLGVFVAVGLIAALTRPGAGVADLFPTLLGGLAAVLALRRMTGSATFAPAPARPAPSRTPGSTGLPEYVIQPGRTPGSWAGEQDDIREPDEQDDVSGPGEQDAAGGPGRPATGQRPGPAVRPTGPAGAPAGRPPGGGQPSSRTPRRKFITTSAVVAGTAVVAGLGGKLLAERGNVNAARKTLRIPAPAKPAPPIPNGADLRIPGLSPFITPNSKFYRVDTAIVLPEITPSSWQLRLHGMVSKEITLSFEELIKRPLIEDYITLTCVSNPVGGPYVGNARWLGASLGALLREAGVSPAANQLLCTSSDGFTSGTPVQVAMDGRDSMLAVAMNGTVLPVEHGFPVRMVVPGLYGYVSACKWITDIEVTTYAAARAYWSDRGWSQQAPIKTESRIDVPGGSVKPGPTAVAGVAWAQHKGVDAVEVRVNRGPWHEARLASVPNIDTWRQWTWQWDATPGTHLIESRATDRTGYTQTAVETPEAPNGASGYPQLAVSVS
jgi:DMSO/TMAO reductase YedYZ molybdopterin-dependent catalytic subunit